MIDLHAHVLPGLDDGPATLERSLQLVRAAHSAGITTIAATPHVDRTWGVAPEQIGQVRASLRQALADSDVDVEIVAGAEIALDRLVDLHDDELAELALGGGRFLLVECPLTVLAGDFLWPVRRLLRDGWGVVLAHPERSPSLHRDHRVLQELVGAGAQIQVTASAFVGDFGERARQSALQLLQAGLVHVVASDAHDVARRPPSTQRAHAFLRESYPALATSWDELTYDTPARILAGTRAAVLRSVGP